MVVLDQNYKRHIAEAFTQAAIENNMITVGADNTETALEICNFYKTILNNLDVTTNANVQVVAQN